MNLTLELKKLHPNATVPAYQTPGAGGMDLHACLDAPVTICPGEVVRIPTGIAIFLGNPNLGLFLLPRSGLGTKKGIVLANTIGLSDSDYQGELGLFLKNTSTETFVVEHNDRIAQAVIVPLFQAELKVVEVFSSETARGTSGFGSTGVESLGDAAVRPFINDRQMFQEMNKPARVYEGEQRRRRDDDKSVPRLFRDPAKAARGESKSLD